MGRAVLGLAVASAMLAPWAGMAQSLHEAARANVWLALHLCEGRTADLEGSAQRFIAAGFAARVDRASNGDTTYYFSAPADTATVEFYFGNMPDGCRVMSSHIGVTEVSGLLDAAAPRLFPTYVRRVTQGPADPTTGQPALCVRYEDPANEIGAVVGVLAQGPDASGDTCIENGTSVLYSSYRV